MENYNLNIPFPEESDYESLGNNFTDEWNFQENIGDDFSHEQPQFDANANGFPLVSSPNSSSIIAQNDAKSTELPLAAAVPDFPQSTTPETFQGTFDAMSPNDVITLIDEFLGRKPSVGNNSSLPAESSFTIPPLFGMQEPNPQMVEAMMQNRSHSMPRNGGLGMPQNRGLSIPRNGGLGMPQNGGFGMPQNGGFGMPQNGGYTMEDNGNFSIHLDNQGQLPFQIDTPQAAEPEINQQEPNYMTSSYPFPDTSLIQPGWQGNQALNQLDQFVIPPRFFDSQTFAPRQPDASTLLGPQQSTAVQLPEQALKQFTFDSLSMNPLIPMTSLPPRTSTASQTPRNASRGAITTGSRMMTATAQSASRGAITMGSRLTSPVDRSASRGTISIGSRLTSPAQSASRGTISIGSRLTSPAKSASRGTISIGSRLTSPAQSASRGTISIGSRLISPAQSGSRGALTTGSMSTSPATQGISSIITGATVVASSPQGSSTHSSMLSNGEVNYRREKRPRASEATSSRGKEVMKEPESNTLESSLPTPEEVQKRLERYNQMVHHEPITNRCYDPRYAELGLPVDPHLRMFLQHPEFSQNILKKNKE